jgi:Secretion system C-terminal sorting domain
MKSRLIVLTSLLLLLVCISLSFALDLRTHDEGKVRLLVNSWGVSGAISHSFPTIDPEFGEVTFNCEYPPESGCENLFRAGLWIGALIVEGDEEIARVSTGLEGWSGDEEMMPHDQNLIEERSNVEGAQDYLGNDIYSPLAVSPEEYISTYADTALTDPNGSQLSNPFDGPHIPLGIEVTQKTMAWNEEENEDFIVFEYTVKNIGENILKDIYLGIYNDSDIGGNESPSWICQDDLTGFLPSALVNGNNVELNAGWMADNDGRARDDTTGNNFTNASVQAITNLEPLDDHIKTSYNWWNSNGQVIYDFGPAWQDDGSDGGWSATLGSPEGDAKAYFVMKNREIDYALYYTNSPEFLANNPQEFIDPITGEVTETHAWRVDDAGHPSDVANGYDSRFMMSWGPFGEYGTVPSEGYYLAPGEEFTFRYVYVFGENFHDADNPQPTNETIAPTLFDFTDLATNIVAAREMWADILLDVGEEPESNLPNGIEISAYPNPFNPTTNISFDLKVAANTQIAVYNTNGQLVATLVDGFRAAGEHRLTFDGSDLSSGVYFVRMKADNFTKSQKLILMK